jgi:hypothetical protein
LLTAEAAMCSLAAAREMLLLSQTATNSFSDNRSKRIGGHSEMTAKAAEWPQITARLPEVVDHLTINILHPKTPLQKRVRRIKYL